MTTFPGGHWPVSGSPDKDPILLAISTWTKAAKYKDHFPFLIPSTPDYKLFQKGWPSFETTAGLLFAFRSVEP